MSIKTKNKRRNRLATGKKTGDDNCTMLITMWASLTYVWIQFFSWAAHESCTHSRRKWSCTRKIITFEPHNLLLSPTPHTLLSAVRGFNGNSRLGQQKWFPRTHGLRVASRVLTRSAIWSLHTRTRQISEYNDNPWVSTSPFPRTHPGQGLPLNFSDVP